jgi:lipopolysaccharide cholinephosphotransferase
MNDLCKIQIEITCHILDVCRRHGLKVWAEWGTLLGAVREHGFIPWDDDIDLMMMRDDYEKLIRLADTEFKSPFFLQCAYTDRQYYRGHAQVRYDGTASIRPDDIDQPFHQGIFVDIFVYDNIPDDLGRKWNKCLRRATLAQKCLQTAYFRKFSFKHPLTSIKFLLARTGTILFGPMNIYRFFERQFTQWNLQDCHRVACPTFNFRKMDHRIKEKSWYSDTVMLPFEDIELPVPVMYHEVLTREYGKDYMTPRKDVTAHGEMLIYTDRPYQDVLAELKNRKS